MKKVIKIFLSVLVSVIFIGLLGICGTYFSGYGSYRTWGILGLIIIGVYILIMVLIWRICKTEEFNEDEGGNNENNEQSCENYDGLYRELEEKLKPSLYQDDDKKFADANVLYKELKNVDDKSDNGVKYIRNVAIELLGITVSTDVLYCRLKPYFNVERYQNMEPYDAERVQMAHIYAQKLEKAKGDILAMEELEKESEDFINQIKEEERRKEEEDKKKKEEEESRENRRAAISILLLLVGIPLVVVIIGVATNKVHKVQDEKTHVGDTVTEDVYIDTIECLDELVEFSDSVLLGKNYINTAKGFAFRYPSSWKVIESGGDIIVMEIPINEKMGSRANVRFMSPNKKFKESVVELAEQAASEGKEAFVDGAYSQIGDIKKVKLSGLDGSLWEYTIEGEDIFMHTVMYILKKSDDSIYIVQGTTCRGESDDINEDLENKIGAIVKSLRFI